MSVEIKNLNGDVLLTVEDAKLRGANLRGANLRGANLRGADLRDINLRGADLWGANLRGADLRGADLRDVNLRDADMRDTNLRDADLWGADLRGADLRGANLRDANLWGAKLPEGFKIARLDLGGWPVTVTPTDTTIGCQIHPNVEWLKFSPEDVVEFASNASVWWKQHKEAVCAVIKDVMQ